MYVDLNSFEEFDFAISIYVAKGDPDSVLVDKKAMPFASTNTQVVIFLRKDLTGAERRY